MLQCVLLREALETDYSWQQLRLMFALSPWDRPMQYGQQAADEMQAKEALFKNFFQNVAVVMRQHSTAHTSKWAVSELAPLLSSGVCTYQWQCSCWMSFSNCRIISQHEAVSGASHSFLCIKGTNS